MADISRTGNLKRITIGLRSSFWFVPALLVLLSIALALVLVGIDESTNRAMAERWPRMFAAEAEGSRAMLSAIATSMITVAGVVFSITIVALAQASTLYTSRVLRNFMRDRLNQTVLGVFLGVFAYCIVVLRAVSGSGGANGEGTLVPSIAVFTGLVLALAAIGFLVVFIHHIAATIQAAEIIRAVMRDTLDALDRQFPHDLGLEAEQPPTAVPPGAAVEWHPVPAAATGYIQSVAPDALLEFAVRHDVLVRMDAGVGEFVVEGRPLAHVAGAPPDAEFVHAFNALYAVDAYRTTDQDPVFGFRQLVDIALKALSPGINDTTTAVTCLDHLSALLQRVAQRRQASPYRSEDSHLRVIARGPDFEDLTDLAFGQILENAQGNTVVLLRMLRAIVELAAVTRSRARRRVLAARIDAVEEVAQSAPRSAHARAQIATAVQAARDACRAETGPGEERDAPARA